MIRFSAYSLKAYLGYFLIGLVCVAGAIGAMTIVGFYLPQDHVASVSAKFNSPQEKIYDAVVALQDESDVKYMVGSEVRPRSRLTEIVEEPGAAFGGTWKIEIDEKGTVTITERGRVYNPIFRFLSRFVFGHESTANQFLGTLRTRLGE